MYNPAGYSCICAWPDSADELTVIGFRRWRQQGPAVWRVI